MKILLNLFWIFFRMGAVCFGGGYALLPIIKRDIVERYQYATEEEVADYFAIGQCTPGVIAVNVSTFIGNKIKGLWGAIAATLGFISPSILIICIIAMFLQNFIDFPIVNYAFEAIRVCVCVLIINAVISLSKKALVDKLTVFLFIAVFLLSAITDLSPVIFVIICGAVGGIYKNLGGVKKQ